MNKSFGLILMLLMLGSFVSPAQTASKWVGNYENTYPRDSGAVKGTTISLTIRLAADDSTYTWSTQELTTLQAPEKFSGTATLTGDTLMLYLLYEDDGGPERYAPSPEPPMMYQFIRDGKNLRDVRRFVDERPAMVFRKL